MFESRLFIYEIGNIADWFSAIGTVAAVFLTLYLIMDERKVRFSVVSFTQEKLKEKEIIPGVTSAFGQKVLIFYGFNSGIKPIALLYQGIRVKKKNPFAKKNEIIRVVEENENDTSLEKNDFDVLELGKKNTERIIDLDDLKKELSKQFPDKGEFVKIEFVYINIKNKEYTDYLKFLNPKLE